MQTPRIVKAATSADLLKLVPALIGVDPRESLVLIAFTGKRTTSGMRFDLPPIDDTGVEALVAWAERVVAGFRAIEGVDGVIPVVFTDATFEDHPDAPRRMLLEFIGALCTGSGMRMKDLLVVGGDGWVSLADPDEPVDPQPLLDLVPDDLSGIDDVQDAALLTTPPTVDESAQQHFTDRLAAWLVGDGHPLEVHGLPVDTGFRARGGLVDRALLGQDVTGFIEAALAEHPGSAVPCECRVLLAALLQAPVLRDVVMMQAAWGRRFARHVALHSIPHAPGDPVDEATVLAFGGGDFARPDPRRVDRAARLLVEVAGHLEPGDRAPLLGTAAWLRWTLGQGSMAGRLVDRALEADPAYGLADLLQIRLSHGHLPEWAFHPEPRTLVGRTWAARTAAR